MKVGDLVIPKMTCAGLAGSERCRVAVITGVRTLFIEVQDGHISRDCARIACGCGESGFLGNYTMELISEKD